MLTFERCLPEDTGIPSACISNFINRLEAHQVPMHSLLLLHRDKLVTEGYYAPYSATTLHRMFSISKSFTAVAIGLLADEGKLSLDDPIVNYFLDKLPADVHPWIAAMTIRDMLMMRTCHASTTYKLDMKKDWVESFFTAEPTHPAGKIFHYDTSSAHTLCALTERLSGMPMLSYLKKKLAILGFSEDSYMLCDPFGVSMGGSGLVATPMDLLKFGYFLSHHGNVCGMQLLSADYLKAATSNLTDTRMTAPVLSEACGYGYQIWQNQKGGYVCYGMGGQLVIVLPDYDLICVTTADTQGIGGGNQLIYDALYEEILPYMVKEPLPHTAYTTILQNELKHLSIAPLAGSHCEKDAALLLERYSNKVFHFTDNTQGFGKMYLTCSDTDASAPTKKGSCRGGILHFTLHGQDYELKFGFDKLICDTFPQYNMKCATSGLWLSENTLYLKSHIIDAYVGSVHMEFAFGEQDVTVFLKKQEESLFSEFQGHLYGELEV